MIYLVIIAAALALCFAAFNYITVRRMPEGNEKMQEIASAIRVGANAFINYEYKVLYTVVAIVAVMAPCVILGAGIIVAYYVSGMYGVAMAAMGMLSFVTATVSVDTYGPISDNAGGIAEMSGLEPEVRKITDTLDSVGNTTAAIGKGFAIGSGALAALALMISYLYSYNDFSTALILNIIEPMTLAGAIMGVNSTPFVRQYGILLTNGVLFNAKRSTEQEVYWGIQTGSR